MTNPLLYHGTGGTNADEILQPTMGWTDFRFNNKNKKFKNLYAFDSLE
jgi:hypothetical protein